MKLLLFKSIYEPIGKLSKKFDRNKKYSSKDIPFLLEDDEEKKEDDEDIDDTASSEKVEEPQEEPKEVDNGTDSTQQEIENPDEKEEPESSDEPEEPEVQEEPEQKDSTTNQVQQPTPSSNEPPKTEIVPQKQGEPKENWSSLKKTLFFIKGKRLVELFKNFVNHTKSKPVDSSRFKDFKCSQLYPNSPYTVAHITAQCDSKAYPGVYYKQWIQLHRDRETQDWSFNNKAEVRCSCPDFNYSKAYSNKQHKALAGTVGHHIRQVNGTYVDQAIPARIRNPRDIPMLCKHLAGLCILASKQKVAGKPVIKDSKDIR